ncbi:MAG: SdpI family protein [Christensenellales bacterium]|jgi:uncharacterized membrane protein
MAFLVLAMLLIPLVFLGIGLLWKKRPPRKINWAYGYRTRRSTASQQAWDFAHRYFAKLALWTGAILLLGTAAAIVAAMSVASDEGLKTAALYCTLVQSIALFVPIIVAEARLRKEFDEEGKPKK